MLQCIRPWRFVAMDSKPVALKLETIDWIGYDIFHNIAKRNLEKQQSLNDLKTSRVFQFFNQQTRRGFYRSLQILRHYGTDIHFTFQSSCVLHHTKGNSSYLNFPYRVTYFVHQFPKILQSISILNRRKKRGFLKIVYILHSDVNIPLKF